MQVVKSESNQLADFGVPDHDGRIEQLALGAMLCSEEACFYGLSHLTKQHFYYESHQMTYTAIKDCYERNEVGYVFVASELTDRGHDGFVTTSELLLYTSEVPAPHGQIRAACKKLNNYLIHRRMKQAGVRVHDLAKHGDIDGARKVIEEAAMIPRDEVPERSTQDVADAVFAHLIDVTKGGGKGFETGVDGLDELVNGLQRKSVYVFGGRAGEGKSSLGIQLSLQPACREKARVYYFSMEMSEEQVVTRAIQLLCGFSLRPQAVRTYPAATIKEIEAAKDDFKKLEYRIDATRPSLRQMIAKARALRGEVDIFVIDNLQNINVDGVNDLVPRVAAATDACKAVFAKESNAVVISLSHVNQDAMKEDEPDLRHLLGGGSIHRDADFVGFFLRSDYGYAPAGGATEAKLVVRKNRDHPLATIPLDWLGKVGRVTDRAERDRGY